MNRVIAVSTNKGGVLKTSIVTNLASAFSIDGNKVLIIDADNQGNASLSFGMNPDEFENSLYDVVLSGLNVENSIYNVYENIDIIPSNDDMTFFDFDVLTNISRFPKPFHLFKDNLSHLKERYDVIFIDTPPNLGLVHGNVLVYCNEVLIPFQPESYSMRSLIKMLNSISQFKNEHNLDLGVLGVVGTLVDSRTVLHSQVLQECRRFCYENDINMLDTVIPRSIRFASSVAYSGLPAVLSDKNNDLVKSYIDLKNEID